MLCLQKGMLGHVRYYLSSRGKLPIGIHQFPRLWALPAESSFWYPQVRAGDMYNVEPAPLQERLVRIPAQVIAVEPLGAETLLMLALRDTKEAIVARVGREAGVRSGDSTTIALDTAAIRLFDVATKKAIPCFQRPV
jgi:multiple sugar transport system ATP-binding protein